MMPRSNCAHKMAVTTMVRYCDANDARLEGLALEKTVPAGSLSRIGHGILMASQLELK
jgi:hypothetical protein